jgi:subtilase family serine protease
LRSNLRRTSQLVVIVLGLAGALIASGVMTAAASVRLVRVGSNAPIPAGARALGAVPSTTALQLTVALRPQDPSSLQAFATGVSTPGSALFRHYVTVSEFASRFGATDQQVAAVESSLRSDGLTVGSVLPNHLTISVSGTAAQVEKAFSVSLSQVKLASGRTAYANAQAPALPSTISSYVEGVVGLDSLGTYTAQGVSGHAATPGGLVRSRAIPHAATGGPTPCSAATNAANAPRSQGVGGYTADVIAQAYQFPNYYLAGDTGAGQTVALFELQPYDPTDIAQYQLCYGTNVPITNVPVDGGPGPYTPGKSDDSEAALDLEQVIGLAPGASIQVYEGPNSSTGSLDTLSNIVSTNQAKVISSSFGICEALAGGTAMNSENGLYAEAAAQGQSYFVASGDQGSASCSANQPTNTSLSVLDPAAQPFVTGVGGTNLYASNGQGDVFYVPGDTAIESVWNDGSTQNSQGQGVAHATTGGLSSQWPMPSYQSGSATSLGVINANSHNGPCGAALCRETPDVSADGDSNTGYAVFANGNSGGGWGIIGGTSAAAPLWAAFTALMNASSTCRGTTVGFENPSLYSIAGSSYLSDFRDVSTARRGRMLHPEVIGFGAGGQKGPSATHRVRTPLGQAHGGPCVGDRGRPLQRILQCLVGSEPLDVPGVELAQVAGGTLGSEVLAGPLDHPVKLGQDLFAAGLVSARAEQLLEQPRVAQRAARQLHGGGAGARERLPCQVGAAQAARDQDRDRELLDQPPRELVVGGARVALRGVARVDAQAGHPALVG